MPTNPFGWMGSAGQNIDQMMQVQQQNKQNQDLFAPNRNAAAAQGQRQVMPQWQGGNLNAAQIGQQGQAATQNWNRQMQGWQNQAQQGGGNWQDYAQQENMANYNRQYGQNPGASSQMTNYPGPGGGQPGGQGQGNSQYQTLLRQFAGPTGDTSRLTFEQQAQLAASRGGGGQPGFGQMGWTPPPYQGGQQAPNQYGGQGAANQYNRSYQPGYGGTGLFGGGQGGSQGQAVSDFLGGVSPNQNQTYPGQQGGLPPGPPAYNPVAGGAGDIMKQWGSSPFVNPSFYANKDQSMQADRYSTNYAIPYGNLALQQQAQDIQQAQFGTTSGMQQQVNQAGIQRDIEGSRREDIGLDYGIYAGDREFGQRSKEFDTTTGFNYAQLGQQGALTREGYKNQADIAGAGYASQEKIAGMNNQLEKYGIDTTRLTAQDTIALQRQLGLGQLGLGQQAEERQGRQQTMDEAFRQAQQKQEAALTRERFQNDLMQSRYGAFGRAQAPNMTMRGGWR